MKQTQRDKIVQDLVTWKHPERGALTSEEERMVIESLLITIKEDYSLWMRYRPGVKSFIY